MVVKEDSSTTNNMDGSRIYSYIHTFLAILALYLAYKCFHGFQVLPLIAACCCPHIFLVYAAYMIFITKECSIY
jgi:hypothetical protein